MISRVVLAAVLVATVLLALATITFYYNNYSIPSPSSNQLPPSIDQADLNWAGYAVAYNFSDPKPLVTEVNGSWVVPNVEVSQNDTFSAVWVGIGGVFGHSLIQTGTEQDCVGGEVAYFAWYELLPADSVTITTMDISPGDTITASISLVNAAENTWSIFISDVSTAQSFQQNFHYLSSQLSGEWVVERPDVDNSLSAVANFGSVTLSNCTVVVDNSAVGLNCYPSERFFIYDTRGTRLADVSDLSSDGSSFTVTYLTSE
jgi:hypothetical protein